MEELALPTRAIQLSDEVLKLCTGLAAHAAYVKPQSQHPAFVKSYLA